MLQTYFSEFLTLALVHLLVVVVPGPDFAITVRQSVRFGRKRGLVTALGIGLGISLHVGYTLLGVGALLHAYAWLLSLASALGALYLVYLGVALIRSRPGPSVGDAQDKVRLASAYLGEPHPSVLRTFWLGFLTNATNPKATLFFMAIFTSLVSVTTPLPVQALYGVWMCCVNAAWFMVVATLFTLPYVRNGFLRIGHWLERLMGAVLLMFAARLLIQLIEEHPNLGF